MRQLARAWSGRSASAGRSLITVLAILAVAALVLAGCEQGGGPGPADEPTIAAEPTAETADEEPTEEPIPEATPSRLVELRKAVAAGEITVKGFGMGLERIEIEITDRTDDALRVVVHPGTLFDAGRSKVQAMVVTSKDVIGVGPGETVRTTLDAACSEMELDQPGDTDRFRLATRSIPVDLRKLLAVEGFADEEFRVRQFAVWTITDDPLRDGYVGLGTFGFGSGPDAAEITAIRRLFADAGIDPEQYRATR